MCLEPDDPDGANSLAAMQKRQAETGITPAEWWRSPNAGDPETQYCRRCKRPTEYGSRLCTQCEIALFGED